MRTLDLSLILMTVFFWLGSVVYYYRIEIIEWLDNRIRYEPLALRLRRCLPPERR